MRVYGKTSHNANSPVNGVVKEGIFSAEVSFGYFSKKDGIRHQFDLCEECYDRMTREFLIPVTIQEETELC